MTPEQYLSALDAHYRGDLQRLLQEILPSIQVANEPKGQKCGEPGKFSTKVTCPWV